MAATRMYPLSAQEREAVRRVLNEDDLDRLFLQALREFTWGARSDLEAVAAAHPKVAAAVPRWLASARRRNLIQRRENGSGLEWTLTEIGNKRLADLMAKAEPPRLRPSKRLR